MTDRTVLEWYQRHDQRPCCQDRRCGHANPGDFWRRDRLNDDTISFAVTQNKQYRVQVMG